MMGAIHADSGQRPDRFRRDDPLMLLDIGQRVSLAVETGRFAWDLAEVAKSLFADVGRLMGTHT